MIESGELIRAFDDAARAQLCSKQLIVNVF